MLQSLVQLAMAAPGGGGGEAQNHSSFYMFGWFAIMIAIFYFILIRPQQRREKARRALLEQVKTGDKVMFAGGLLGVVANAKEHTFVIRIAEKVKIEVARSSVSQVLEKGDVPEEQAGS